MEFDIHGVGRTSQRGQSWNGKIGSDFQAENGMNGIHFVRQSKCRVLGARSRSCSPSRHESVASFWLRHRFGLRIPVFASVPAPTRKRSTSASNTAFLAPV